MRPIEELINSGACSQATNKTLTKKEAEAVERHIWANSTTITPYQLKSLKGLAAIRGDFYTRYKNSCK